MRAPGKVPVTRTHSVWSLGLIGFGRLQILTGKCIRGVRKSAGKKMKSNVSGWLPWLVERVTPDPELVSSCPTLGKELT